jgi:hypothetical protein
VQKCAYRIKKAAGSTASGLPGSKLIPRMKHYSAPVRFKLAAALGDVESKTSLEVQPFRSRKDNTAILLKLSGSQVTPASLFQFHEPDNSGFESNASAPLQSADGETNAAPPAVPVAGASLDEKGTRNVDAVDADNPARPISLLTGKSTGNSAIFWAQKGVLGVEKPCAANTSG